MTADANGPVTDLRTRLRAVAPQLSAAAAEVLEVLAKDPVAASRLTVRELAAAAGTSTATVLRVARALGYDGFSDLRLALAAAGGPAEPLAPLGADIALDDDAATTVRTLASLERAQLQETADLLDPEALDAAAVAVSGARRVLLLGVGASGIVAADLAAKLTRLGVAAQAVPERDSAVPIASLLGEEDVVIVVSNSGATPAVLEPLRIAAGNGVRAVAVTGVPRSPLAELADWILVTAGREFGFRAAAMASRTGQLLVGDALFVRVVRARPDAVDALHRTYEALHHHDSRSE